MSAMKGQGSPARALLIAAAIVHCSALAHIPAAPRLTTARFPGIIRMSEAAEPQTSPPQLVAQRASVSGLQPRQSGEQQYVGVPPPSSGAPVERSMFQKARGPFTGITVLAVAAVATWQSNRSYQKRQEDLLAVFGRTMVVNMDNEREMVNCIQSIRKQLGPGRFKGRMFVSFLKSFAKSAPLGVAAIQSLQQVISMMKLTDAEVAEELGVTATDLKGQPSVLGKLVFISERAAPQATKQANLRDQFPNWSAETVDVLQTAMLERLFGEIVEESGSVDQQILQVLRLPEAEGARLMKEIQDKKDAAEAVAAAEREEEERAERMRRALEDAVVAETPKPAEPKLADPEEKPTVSPPAADDDDEPVSPPAGGAHEYECTKCGYTLFPASGREFKFFGDSFKCPQCGADKSAFKDVGAV